MGNGNYNSPLDAVTNYGGRWNNISSHHRTLDEVINYMNRICKNIGAMVMDDLERLQAEEKKPRAERITSDYYT